MLIEFLKAHYELIGSIILVLLSLILTLVKKKPVKVVDTLAQAVISYLPIVINQAEASNLKGEAKLNLCIRLLQEWASLNHLELNDYYLDLAKKHIEIILSTPQKK